jgi:hypothetical protein
MSHQIVDALRSLDYDRRSAKAVGAMPNVHSDAVEALAAAVAVAEVQKYQCPPDVAKALVPLLPSVHTGGANGGATNLGMAQPHSPGTAVSPERMHSYAQRTASSVSGGSSTYDRRSSAGSALPPNPTAALIGPDGVSTAAGGMGVAPVTVEVAGATGSFALTAPRHGGVRISRRGVMDYARAAKPFVTQEPTQSSCVEPDAVGAAATSATPSSATDVGGPVASSAALPPPPLPPRPPPLPPPLTPGFVPVAFVHLNTFDGANFNPVAAHRFRSGLAAAMSSADLGRGPGAASWGRGGPAAARAPSYVLRMRSGADALWCSLLAAELTGMF